MDTRGTTLLLALLLIVGLAGCSGGPSPVTDLNRRIVTAAELQRKDPNATYVVEPPDTIKVEFFNEPSLTRVVRLRQDGMVTLPHVEDVEVGGLTPIEIREHLEDLYSRFYREAKLLVTVEGFNSKKVFISGEVGSQGAQAYTGNQTVLDVIASAGGLTRRAAWTRVKVIRGDKDNPEVYKVNLKRLLLYGDSTQNVSLAENDVVRVPPTHLAWVGYQMEALLFPFRGILGVWGTTNSLSNN